MKKHKTTRRKKIFKKYLKFKPKITSLAKIALLFWYALAWSWVFESDFVRLSGSKTIGFIIASIVVLINVNVSVAIIWQGLKFTKNIFQKLPTASAIIASIMIMSAFDLLAVWLTAFLWIGPGGSWDTILPFGSPSLVLMYTPLRFATRLIGMFGLAGFEWVILFLIFYKKQFRQAILSLAALIILSFTGNILYKNSDGQSIKAKIVSENLDSRLPAIDPGDADLVVFPENGLDGINNNNYHARLVRQSGSRAAFIGSNQVTSDWKVDDKNYLVFGILERGVISKQQKTRLIPGGEDLAYTAHALLRMTKQDAIIKYFKSHRSMQKGTSKIQPLRVSPQLIVGAEVCSSIIAPSDYRQLSESGANLLTNSASLGVFQNSKMFAWQQLGLSKFIATANARSFLQSSNDSAAYTVNKDGQITASVKPKNVISTETHTNKRLTLYTITGELLAKIGIVLIVIFAIKNRFATNKSKKP